MINGADAQCHCITNIVIECDLEETDHPGQTTMNVQIFSPERKTGEALIMEKISRLVWKHHGSVKLMDDTTFCATLDDTALAPIGVCHLPVRDRGNFRHT